jgi:hypothetical protein
MLGDGGGQIHDLKLAMWRDLDPRDVVPSVLV